MIHITCQHCTRDIRVADEHAGKKIRCPGCKEVLVLPAAAPAVKPAKAAPAPSPSPIKKAAPPPVPKRRPPEDDDEEIAVADAVAEDEDEDDEPRPRKRKRIKRRSRGRKGRYADCPNCDAPGDASPVVFTWWGGMIGPRLLSHVRCDDCGTCYNGSSGKSNDTAILIYTLVSVFISLMILGLVLIATILGH
jgi:hypothetical protein